MNLVKRMVKERNEALFSLDRDKIEKYFIKAEVPIPENDTIFWASVYKCICNITNSPPELVEKAEKWLAEHNMKPQMFY